MVFVRNVCVEERSDGTNAINLKHLCETREIHSKVSKRVVNVLPRITTAIDISRVGVI